VAKARSSSCTQTAVCTWKPECGLAPLLAPRFTGGITGTRVAKD